MNVLLDPGIYFRKSFGGVHRNALEHEKALIKYDDLNLENLRKHLDFEDGRLGRIRYLLWLNYRLNKFLKSKHIDVVHFFNYYCPRTASEINCKKVVTIHDLRFHFINEGKKIVKVNRNRNIVNALHNADAIVTVSDATGNDIVNIYGEQFSEKIHTIHNGISSFWFEDKNPENVSAEIVEFCKNEKFVILPGPVSSRKQHTKVLKILASYLIKNNYGLVVFGGGDELQEFDILAKSISGLKYRSFGIVSDESMRYLYDHASLGFFMSIYEGFGIPIIEMGSRGLPCLVADNSSLPEVSGRNNNLIIHDDSDILNKAKLILNDKILRDNLSRFVAENASKFTWEASTHRLYELYRSLV